MSTNDLPPLPAARFPQMYYCNKCGKFPLSSEHDGCNYMAVTDGSGAKFSADQMQAYARAAVAADRAKREPDMRHPKIQNLIGSKARTEIRMQLVEELIEDPDCELTCLDMEYWDSLHDRLREALMAKRAVPEGWQLVPKIPTAPMLHVIRNAVTQGEFPSSMYIALLAAAPLPKEQT